MLVRLKEEPLSTFGGSENWEAILEIRVGCSQKDEQSCCLTQLQHAWTNPEDSIP